MQITNVLCERILTQVSEVENEPDTGLDDFAAADSHATGSDY